MDVYNTTAMCVAHKFPNFDDDLGAEIGFAVIESLSDNFSLFKNLILALLTWFFVIIG